jgi:hypothetical protein
MHFSRAKNRTRADWFGCWLARRSLRIRWVNRLLELVGGGDGAESRISGALDWRQDLPPRRNGGGILKRNMEESEAVSD